MQDLTLSLLQTNVEWHNPEANRALLEKKILTIVNKPNVIVLPEMFTTGFTMEVKNNAEPTEGPTLQWLKKLAAQTGSVLTGSIIVTEKGKYYNRLYWVKPNGEVQHYDKRHLFRMADEDKHFSEGNSNPVMEVNGWKVKPLICYDLRFPVWSRNVNQAYDLLLYVANWPQARVGAWDTLLKARAIENLCYSVGVNRVGTDEMNIVYNGHSACYNFKGEVLTEQTEVDDIIHIKISKTELISYRDKFPAYLDADSFQINNFL